LWTPRDGANEREIPTFSHSLHFGGAEIAEVSYRENAARRRAENETGEIVAHRQAIAQRGERRVSRQEDRNPCHQWMFDPTETHANAVNTLIWSTMTPNAEILSKKLTPGMVIRGLDKGQWIELVDEPGFVYKSRRVAKLEKWQFPCCLSRG